MSREIEDMEQRSRVRSTKRDKARGPAVWDREKALLQTAGLCARCEQCEMELRRLLARHGVTGADADYVIEYLYEHRYLDEGRYARAYARDKILLGGWGRIKVRTMLIAHRISPADIKAAIEAVSADDYKMVVAKAVAAAARREDVESYEGRMKVVRRLYARGFEPDLVRDALRSLSAGE